MEGENVFIEPWKAALLIANAIAGFLFNSLIVVIIYRNPRLRSSFNATIVNASLADMIVSLNLLASTIEMILKNGGTFTTEVWCKGTGFVNLLSFVASVMSLAAVSMNRYFLICQRSIYEKLFTRFGTCLYIALVWIISALLSTPPFYGWTRFSYDAGKSICFADWKSSLPYMLFMIIICFCGPISATLLSLFFILRIKRQTEVEQANSEIDIFSAELSQITKLKQQKDERQITKSVVVIAAVFFIAWGPFVVIMFIEAFSTAAVPPWADFSTLYLGCLNSSVNPLVYMYMNTNFRKEIKRYLGNRINSI